jgi:hypothetical protein
MITAERLRELFNYDPETGVWRWIARSSPYSCICVGDVAGRVGGRGYRGIKIDKREYPAARLAWLYMTGEWPRAEIDHVNGNRVDNRWCNLREASNSQNNANKSMTLVTHQGSRGFRGIKRPENGGRRFQLMARRGFLAISPRLNAHSSRIVSPLGKTLVIMRG